jgi:predicted  nucleic acid-binding Zn-ribbon protein
MNADLEKLIRLQKAESELRRVEAELADVPGRKAEFEARLEEERVRLNNVREELAASQKARRQLEAELMDLEGRRSKYKGQLMDVKTNKEYTAMLHEIEAVEREIRGREDLILGEMEKAESLGEEIRREEALFKEVEGRHRSEVLALERRASFLAEEQARLGGEREAVAETVPTALRELFQRVARLRGTAVAEVRDATCQLCHMKLRPQMFLDLKRNEQILQCPACSRILFFEPAAPETQPQP